MNKMNYIEGYKIENVERALKAILTRTSALQKTKLHYEDAMRQAKNEEEMAELEKEVDNINACLVEYGYLEALLEGDRTDWDNSDHAHCQIEIKK